MTKENMMNIVSELKARNEALMNDMKSLTSEFNEFMQDLAQFSNDIEISLAISKFTSKITSMSQELSMNTNRIDNYTLVIGTME